MKKTYTLLIALLYVCGAMGQSNPLNGYNYDYQEQIFIDYTQTISNKLDSIGIWEQLGPVNNDVLGFAFGDNNADTIYAGSRDNGVFRSIDGGVSWNQINNGLVGDFVRTIGINPANPSSILAGTFTNGLYKSDDAGESWIPIPEVNSDTIINIVFNSINGDTVYVSTIDKGLYRSWDGGNSWEHITPDYISYSLRAFIDPNHSNTVYFVSKDTIFRSMDYGDSWETYYNSSDGAEVGSMAIENGNSSTIFVGTHTQLAKTIDGGTTWEKLIDSTDLIINDIAIDKENNDIICIVSPSIGIYKSDNGGYDWMYLSHGGAYPTMLYLKFHPLSVNVLYACSNGYGLLRTGELATFIDTREMPLGTSIKIYPNPTQTTITIELPTQPSKNTSLTISNTNGQQLLTQAITKPQTEIDISHLPIGIYIIKVWNDKDVMVQKVIKQ